MNGFAALSPPHPTTLFHDLSLISGSGMKLVFDQSCRRIGIILHGEEVQSKKNPLVHVGVGVSARVSLLVSFLTTMIMMMKCVSGLSVCLSSVHFQTWKSLGGGKSLLFWKANKVYQMSHWWCRLSRSAR